MRKGFVGCYFCVSFFYEYNPDAPQRREYQHYMNNIPEWNTMSKSCIFRVGGVGRDYCTAREYEKGAEITSTLETTDTEKQKQRRKVSKQKKPCLTLVNKISRDEAKSGDSFDSSVGNLSLVVPSDGGQPATCSASQPPVFSASQPPVFSASQPPAFSTGQPATLSETPPGSTSNYSALLNRQIGSYV
ncbi:unnamed protein product [Orchesella dallaii]|uniref:Uncharacterized protein n=1 Tax=Orchesella dallaii TaxID=48710 RepID=A0ABP1R0H6_9HEXA